MTSANRPSISFEFFPTKTEAGHEKLLATARRLAEYKPDFFSCTYGAGGSTRDRTLSTVLQLDGEVSYIAQEFERSSAPTITDVPCPGGSRLPSGQYLCEAAQPELDGR